MHFQLWDRKGEGEMTKLIKIIRRETKACYRKRPIVIQLEPPSIVRVKEKGRHLWYETSVEAIFSMAAKAHANKMKAIKKEKKESFKWDSSPF